MPALRNGPPSKRFVSEGSARVLRTLVTSSKPLGVDLIAGQTVLPREAVVSALIDLLDEGYIVQVRPDVPDRSIWDGLFEPSDVIRQAAS